MQLCCTSAVGRQMTTCALQILRISCYFCYSLYSTNELYQQHTSFIIGYTDAPVIMQNLCHTSCCYPSSCTECAAAVLNVPLQSTDFHLSSMLMSPHIPWIWAPRSCKTGPERRLLGSGISTPLPFLDVVLVI